MLANINVEDFNKKDLYKLIVIYVEEQTELFSRVCEDNNDEFTLADWFYEHSGVDIKSKNNIKNLSDEEVKTFFENIVFEI